MYISEYAGNFWICIELKMDAKAEDVAEKDSDENYEESDDYIIGGSASIHGSWQGPLLPFLYFWQN
jgi:hypothetical protein